MSIDTQSKQETPVVEVEAPVEAAPQDDAATEILEGEHANEAEFAAGFSGESMPQHDAQAVQQQAEPNPKAQAVTLTASDLEQLQARAAEIDKLKEREQRIYGTLGSLKQSIDQLRNQPRPQATAVQLTKEKLAKLNQAFPEMAELLADDLNGVLSGAGSDSVDRAQLEQAVEARLTERMQQSQLAMQQQFEAKVLTVMHPDWKQVVPSPEFQQWRQALPDADRAELDSSWDAELIGSRISEFKQWKNKAAQGQDLKRNRLAAAITPKGAAQAPAKTVEDAFIEGFKSA